MPISSFLRSTSSHAFSQAFSRCQSTARRILPRALAAVFLALCAALCPAASIRGVVTDASGARVSGAAVSLVSNGRVIASAVSVSDGSFQITTGSSGRFFIVVSAKSFRQLQTPDFYAGQFDSLERNVVLEPEWVRESIVVTANGMPTPQPQTSAATTVLSPLDLSLRTDLVSALRLMPGTFVAQDGQLGAQTSLFVRGGDSTSNETLLDGVSIDDMGGRFDFGPLSTTAVESAEVYRGPDSSLYADAGSGVVSLTTPHGTTSFPSLLFQGSAGNLNTSREELELAGAHSKLDYLGAFSWLQTANNLPMDKYHVATSAANVGWALNGATQIRATLRYGVDATGVPNQWDFYGIADDRKEGDQDLYGSGTVDNQTTATFHNRFQFGLARKREQSQQWYPAGVCIPADSCDGAPDSFTGGNFYGLPLTIAGANGYSAAGPALLNYSAANGSVYPNRLDLISNRDQILYQGDLQLTPHLLLLAGFHYENKRVAEREPVFLIDDALTVTNYDFVFGAHGDFKSRLFYTLRGSVEHYQLFGSIFSPNAGLSYYLLRPRAGVFSGTRLTFSFAQGAREPALTEEFGSLYDFLKLNGGEATIQQLGISPIEAPTTRTWEGGGEQAFWGKHIVFRASYFHNEFGRDIESVGAGLVPELLPNLTPQQQQALEATLQSESAFSLELNSLAFRAQGIESTVEGGLGSNIFLRGGYTYLDSVVQRSFSSDNQALAGGYAPIFDGIPVGIYSPLVGARPFRRPPHTGFFTATYANKRITGIFNAAFASRSDDSTFLGYADLQQGNSLVLPNRNLDFGYAKLDIGGSYQWFTWLDVFAQAENLTDNQHIAPIGYPSLPFTLRTGVRLRWGPGSGH
jgi:iron complex outermembrane receptor protein/vitamin B12 transporter